MMTILLLFIGAHATVTAYDHQELMKVKHTESAHYAETTDRLDRHADAIKHLYKPKQDGYQAPKDSWMEGL